MKSSKSQSSMHIFRAGKSGLKTQLRTSEPLSTEQSCANMHMSKSLNHHIPTEAYSVLKQTILRMMTMTHSSHIRFKTKTLFLQHRNILSKHWENTDKQWTAMHCVSGFWRLHSVTKWTSFLEPKQKGQTNAETNVFGFFIWRDKKRWTTTKDKLKCKQWT